MSAGPSQQPDLQASWVVGSAALQELGADWDALADPGDPFMRREWLEPWLDAFGGECQPAVCVARRAERIVGLIPLLRKHGCLAAMSNEPVPYHLKRWWFALGWPAFAALMATFWLMIARPALW